MYTNDQTADAVHDADGVEGQTTVGSPDALDGSRTTEDAVPGAASSHPKPNRIVLQALTERAMVRIEVDGEIASDCLLGVSDPIYDDVAISRIDGKGERDGFRFSGTMVDLEIVEGDVEVALDLQRDDPFGRGKPTRLSIHAQGPDVDYGFAVSGAVEPVSGTVSGDGERDEVVSGTVAGSGVDEYLFTGEISGFEASTDEVLVMVDDQVVDPDDLE